MDFLNSAFIVIVGVIGSIVTIGLFIEHAMKQKHMSKLTIGIALLSSIFLGLYFVSLRPHLPSFLIGFCVFIEVVFSVVALLLCGELFMRRVDLRTYMGKGLLWFTVIVLLLSSAPFWVTWALAPSSVPSQSSLPTNTAATTLQMYCQALVHNEFAHASTYFSNVTTHTSVLSQEDLARNVQTDTKDAGKLIACTSTVQASFTDPNGTPYVYGAIIYSFRNKGAMGFRQYGLFQDPFSSTWWIDTAYWRDPHVVY